MNICLLAEKYPPDPGGLAISTRRLARGLAAEGHNVHVCAPQPALAPGQVTRTAEAGLITLHRLGTHRRVEDTWADWFDLINRLHRQAAFDLLHGYYLTGAGFVTVYAGHYLDLPTVVSARGNDLDRAVFNPGQTGAVTWTLAHASAVTAVSHDLATKARALAPTCQPQVVPNGVDAALFAPAPSNPTLRRQWGLAETGPLLGFVGEARLKKGLTILLPAFAQVVAQARTTNQPEPILWLIGGIRPDDGDILRVFQTRQPDLRVHVSPYTDHADLPPLYRLLDLLVLPSLRDGLPNALLEGMACERAVVAARVGGISDVIHHGENGLLVPPGEVFTLAETITSLLQTPERRAKLGRAARQTVLAHFDPARELQDNLTLYRRLLTSSAPLDTLLADSPGPPAR
jgi:glycosyltransferase involved in cell wall biosynthesis